MKRMKIPLLFVTLLFVSAFLSGCWDSKDINEKSILTAVALDKIDDEIYFYVEIANIEGGKTEGKNGSSGNKYIYVKSHGKTITEARENLDRQLDKEVYLSANRTVILTESFAKEHLVEYLYRLRADESYRKKTITVITKEDPEEMLQKSNAENRSVGFSIDETLVSIEESGLSFMRTTARFLEILSSKYTGMLISCMGLQDDQNILMGYSVINGTTITGFIPVEESNGIIFFKADKPKFYYIVPYQDHKYTIEVSLKKRGITPSYKGAEIRFDIEFEFEAKLMYGDKPTPYHFDDVTTKKVTEILTNMLKKELTDTVWQAQQIYLCDYLQFDDEFRIKYPVEFEQMDWQKEFENARYDIKVNVNLSGTWMMDYETKEQK